MAKARKSVMGVEAPAPRVTPAAIWLGLRLLGLPLLAGLVVVDIAIWLVAKAIWDVCIGVWCWF